MQGLRLIHASKRNSSWMMIIAMLPWGQWRSCLTHLHDWDLKKTWPYIQTIFGKKNSWKKIIACFVDAKFQINQKIDNAFTKWKWNHSFNLTQLENTSILHYQKIKWRYTSRCNNLLKIYKIVMTSWHGNPFRATDLCFKIHRPLVHSLHKLPAMRNFNIPMCLARKCFWTNEEVAGDLRRPGFRVILTLIKHTRVIIWQGWFLACSQPMRDVVAK